MSTCAPGSCVGLGCASRWLLFSDAGTVLPRSLLSCFQLLMPSLPLHRYLLPLPPSLPPLQTSRPNAGVYPFQLGRHARKEARGDVPRGDKWIKGQAKNRAMVSGPSLTHVLRYCISWSPPTLGTASYCSTSGTTPPSSPPFFLSPFFIPSQPCSSPVLHANTCWERRWSG